MTRPRIYISPGRLADVVVLQEEERRHLILVLRLGAGDTLEVFDGRGRVCQATLIREGKSWLLRPGRLEPRPDQAPTVRLGLALLKGRKLDLAVRMATELGVSSIEPFACARSVPRLDPHRAETRVRRLQAIAIQSARQARRSFVPLVHYPATLEEILSGPRPGVSVILDEAATGRTLSDAIEENARSDRLLLVGPEGGFEREEVDRARSRGFEPLGLGLPVLRAETAAVAAAALACLDRRTVVE